MASEPMMLSGLFESREVLAQKMDSALPTVAMSWRKSWLELESPSVSGVPVLSLTSTAVEASGKLPYSSSKE